MYVVHLFIRPRSAFTNLFICPETPIYTTEFTCLSVSIHLFIRPRITINTSENHFLPYWLSSSYATAYSIFLYTPLSPTLF